MFDAIGSENAPTSQIRTDYRGFDPASV